MLLTDKEIVARNIVRGAAPKSQRATTYDATVGEIISCGTRIDDDSFKLRSRGVVWVVSKEEFHVPVDVTGVAALRTAWAHDGVFALNVGVLDPGWQGAVATALVNFGRDDFIVRKGDSFVRVLFFTSQPTAAQPRIREREEYVRDMTGKSRGFSETFLNMTSLVKEVATEVLNFPKWAYLLTIAAIVISLIAIYAPIAYSVWSDRVKDQVVIGDLGRRLQTLEDRMKERASVEEANATNSGPKASEPKKIAKRAKE